MGYDFGSWIIKSLCLPPVFVELSTLRKVHCPVVRTLKQLKRLRWQGTEAPGQHPCKEPSRKLVLQAQTNLQMTAVLANILTASE